MTRAAERHEGLDERALLLAAGLAELAVSTVGSAVGSALGAVRGCCAGRTRGSWRGGRAGARGAGASCAGPVHGAAPAHLETLARLALARQAAADDV